MAQLVAQSSGAAPKVGINWIRRFLTRYPEIHIKVGVKIKALRIRNVTRESLYAWFTLVEEVIQRRNIDQADIWNMDETGIALGVYNNQTVIGSSSSTRSYIQRPKNREWVSIIKAISAGT